MERRGGWEIRRWMQTLACSRTLTDFPQENPVQKNKTYRMCTSTESRIVSDKTMQMALLKIENGAFY